MDMKSFKVVAFMIFLGVILFIAVGCTESFQNQSSQSEIWKKVNGTFWTSIENASRSEYVEFTDHIRFFEKDKKMYCEWSSQPSGGKLESLHLIFEVTSVADQQLKVQTPPSFQPKLIGSRFNQEVVERTIVLKENQLIFDGQVFLPAEWTNVKQLQSSRDVDNLTLNTATWNQIKASTWHSIDVDPPQPQYFFAGDKLRFYEENQRAYCEWLIELSGVYVNKGKVFEITISKENEIQLHAPLLLDQQQQKSDADHVKSEKLIRLDGDQLIFEERIYRKLFK